MKKFPPKLFDPNKPPGGLLPPKESAEPAGNLVKEEEASYGEEVN